MGDATPPQNDRRESAGQSFRQAGQALSLGMEMAVPAIVGWWLDTWFQSTPVGLLIGGGLGFATALLHASRLIERDKPGPSQTPESPPTTTALDAVVPGEETQEDTETPEK